jgi:aldehyde dehydrogenase (NAD+)
MHFRPKPLALYVFSSSQKILDYFIDNTSSGAVFCNDFVVQNGWEGLRVGDSGIGNYHGKYSYETFTHQNRVSLFGTFLTLLKPYGNKESFAQ